MQRRKRMTTQIFKQLKSQLKQVTNFHHHHHKGSEYMSMDDSELQ